MTGIIYSLSSLAEHFGVAIAFISGLMLMFGIGYFFGDIIYKKFNKKD